MADDADHESDDTPSSRPRRSPSRGKVTTSAVLSAAVAGNAEVFPSLLALHVADGAIIADVTFGTGVFWRDVAPGRYRVLASDRDRSSRFIASARASGLPCLPGVDCRRLPYGDASLDAVVLDPPYLESFYRRTPSHRGARGSHGHFSDFYSHGGEGAAADGPKWHEAVVAMYAQAGREAWRVLRDRGVLLVKCQDEVSANLQRLTHVEIITDYERLGFYTKDLFVVVRPNRPVVARLLRQVHARKNHSYFLVFVKGGRSVRSRGKAAARDHA